jgi:hypothetical protein
MVLSQKVGTGLTVEDALLWNHVEARHSEPDGFVLRLNTF